MTKNKILWQLFLLLCLSSLIACRSSSNDMPNKPEVGPAVTTVKTAEPAPTTVAKTTTPTPSLTATPEKPVVVANDPAPAALTTVPTPIPVADTHGIRVLYFDSWETTLLPFIEGGVAQGGFAQLSALIAKNKDSATLVCSTGNFLSGDVNDRRPAIAAANLLSVNVTALGKLELNYGVKNLKKQLKSAAFSVVSANVYQGETRLFEPFVVRKFGELRIGIIGITSEEAAVQAQPTAIEGLLFKDPIVEAKKALAELGDQSDIVILLSNLRHNEDVKLAEAIPGIQLIIGRYDVDATHRETQVGSVKIVRVNKKRGAELGELRLQSNPGKWQCGTPHFYQIGPMTTDCQKLTPSGDAQTLLNKWQEEEKEMAEVISHTDVMLEGDYQKVRQQETNFGNLLADILLSLRPQADIAIINSGCIRSSIPAGPITKGALALAIPYPNKVVELAISGETLKEVLENGVAQYEKVSGAFLQIAGFSFVCDLAKPSFSRVSDIKIHGEPVASKKDYRLITLDYIASGGDDYIMLKNCERAFSSEAAFPKIVNDYLKQKGKIATGVENRIQIIKVDNE